MSVGIRGSERKAVRAVATSDELYWGVGASNIRKDSIKKYYFFLYFFPTFLIYSGELRASKAARNMKASPTAPEPS